MIVVPAAPRGPAPGEENNREFFAEHVAVLRNAHAGLKRWLAEHAWLEEPLPAEDVAGHRQLREHTTIPVAVGESMYHLAQFREYLERGACSIVQPDVARIGGITPWVKVAHMAEGFNVPVCPHFLMELHVSLCAAVPNAAWVEYIPQLDDITTSRIRVEQGYAYPPESPGLGIAWDWPAIAKRQVFDCTIPS